MVYKLPKKAKRTEADVDGKVASKLFKMRHYPFTLEVKMKGNKPSRHQEAHLQKVAKTGEFLYKPPDAGHRNPSDYLCLKNADAILCQVDGRKVSCVVYNTQEVFDFRI